MRVVSYTTNSRGRPESKNINLMNKLRKFYDDTFKHLVVEKANYTNLSHILDYLSPSMVTCIENNIKLRFISHLSNYIKYSLNEKVDKKTFSKIRTDILNKGDEM
jgi:hypothetical protein